MSTSERAIWSFLRRLDERLQAVEAGVPWPREPVSVAVAGLSEPESERARSPEGVEPGNGHAVSEPAKPARAQRAANGGGVAAPGSRACGPATAEETQADGAGPGSRDPEPEPSPAEACIG